MPNLNNSNPTRSNVRRLIPGLVLILIGVLALIGQFVGGDVLGRFFLLALGLGFVVWGIASRSAGLFIPGGILTGLGAGVLLEDILSASGDLSGAIILLCFAAGWGLIRLLSILFTRDRMLWALIPGGIMALIGLALLAGPEGLNILGAVGKFWPVILILVGLYLIIWRARPRS